MTDNEIIKALECCISNTDENCNKCVCSDSNVCCVDVLLRNALDLINRQKAEIETWKAEYKRACAERDARICTANFFRAEAIKEYEKKAIEKTLAMVYSCDLLSTEDYIECIQSIGKEMAGEDNNSLLVDKQK